MDNRRTKNNIFPILEFPQFRWDGVHSSRDSHWSRNEIITCNEIANINVKICSTERNKCSNESFEISEWIDSRKSRCCKDSKFPSSVGMLPLSLFPAVRNSIVIHSGVRHHAL